MSSSDEKDTSGSRNMFQNIAGGASLKDLTLATLKLLSLDHLRVDVRVQDQENGGRPMDPLIRER